MYLFGDISGTPEERGLIAWSKQMDLINDPTTSEESSTYDFPVGMTVLRKYVCDLKKKIIVITIL